MDAPATAATVTGPVYGVTAAARRAGCSPSYVHRLIKQGRVRPSLPSADGPRRLSERSEPDPAAGALWPARAGRISRSGAAPT